MNNVRNKNAYWSYNGDGRWKERIKGTDKKFHKRLSKRKQKQLMKQELDESNEDKDTKFSSRLTLHQ
jgi:hypothetical protein